MGLSYRHLGRFDEALKYFQEGLKLDPHNAVVSLQYRLHRRAPGKLLRARKAYFSRHFDSNPDFSEALLELANLRVKDKKFAEAAELLRRLCQSEPQTPRWVTTSLAMAERKPPSDGRGTARLECVSNPLEKCSDWAISLSAPF